MSGIDLRQFRAYIVAPTLKDIGLYSLAAERLVLGTALTESGLKYIDQVEAGGDKRPGPAYGPFQMERATHEDLWTNFLSFRPELAARIINETILDRDRCSQMQGNHYYAAAMCRVFYLRVRHPLPAADDLPGMAAYWKRFYNTALGAGKESDFMKKAAPVWAL